MHNASINLQFNAVTFALCIILAQLPPLALSFNLQLKSNSDRRIQTTTTSHSSATPDHHSLSSCRIENFLDGKGVTSLTVVNIPLLQDQCLEGFPSSCGLLISGSKRGEVSLFNVHECSTSFSVETGCNSLKSIDVSAPYPVFAMASCEAPITEEPYHAGKYFLFCGAGDRYLSVYQLSASLSESCQEEHKDRVSLTKLTNVARLGPHTGWVKSVVVNTSTWRLHSIGCNFIETWELQNNGPRWFHSMKRSISSSNEPSIVTTSSDLLCLCLAEQPANPTKLGGKDVEHFIFAGGVDGRIHQWKENGSDPSPMRSVLAHRGRVNCLRFSKAAELLFSCSSDGSLQCRDLNGGWNSENQQLFVGNADEEIRLLTMTIVAEDTHAVELVLGTACGKLVRILATRDEKAFLHLKELDMQSVLLGEPIYAIESTESYDRSHVLAIGHSKGLSIARWS